MSSLLLLVDLLPAQDVPDPGPAPPPGQLAEFGNTVVSWMKWGAIVAGMIGLLAAAIMVIVGRKGRNAVATEGLTGMAWVIAGLAIASSAAGIVGVFV